MAREEYEISLEWAEFSRSAQTGIAGWKSGVHDYGHTEKFGRLVLGVRGYQPGFSAVDQLTGSRYTFAPTPRKVGWLSVTWEECNETSTRILSFSIEFRDLRRTGYDGLRKALSAKPDNNQVYFRFQLDDPDETARLIMRQHPHWSLERAVVLLSGQKVTLAGENQEVRSRLETADAIAAWLPYGMRSQLRISTHAAPNDGAFDLCFTDEAFKDESPELNERAKEYRQKIVKYLKKHDNSQAAVRDIVSSLSQRADPAAADPQSAGAILDEVLDELRGSARGSGPAPSDSRARGAEGLAGLEREARRMLAEGQDPRSILDAVPASSGTASDPWAQAPGLLFLVGLDPSLDQEISQRLARLPEGGLDTKLPSVPSVAPERLRAMLRTVEEQVDSPSSGGLGDLLAAMFGAALLGPCDEEESKILNELAQLAREERLWLARADSIERWMREGS